MTKRITREEWLQNAIADFKTGMFKRHGFTLPDHLYVSMSWPYASRGSRRIAECWYPEASADGKHHINISPIHATGDHALYSLIHELCHVASGKGAAHGPAFRKVALAVGLRGEMRTTPEVTPELSAEVKKLIEDKLGTYPHGKLTPGAGRKKQTTRMFKMECEECHYIVRTSRQNILFYGPVICPCNYKPMIYDPKVDQEMSSAAREDS